MKINRRFSFTAKKGYTLVELALVIVVLSILASIVSPKMQLILQRAYQSKARSNLGQVRTGVNLYYSAHDGQWPLSNYPEGDSHYTSDGLSLTALLAPTYITDVPIPKLVDHQADFNGLSFPFDNAAQLLMTQTPPEDVFIIWGPADYTPLLNSPYAYDNTTGMVYYPNGNYDVSGEFFYTW